MNDIDCVRREVPDPSIMSLTLLIRIIEVSPFVCALSVQYRGRMCDRKAVLEHDRVGVPLPTPLHWARC